MKYIHSIYLTLFYLLVSCNSTKVKKENSIDLTIKSPTNCIHRISINDKDEGKLKVIQDFDIDKKKELITIDSLEFKLDDKRRKSLIDLTNKIAKSNLIKGNHAWDAFSYQLKINNELKRDVYKRDNDIIEIIDKDLDYYCSKY